MNMEYTISIGLNDKDSRRQEISTEDAYQIVFDAFPDCTIKETEGHSPTPTGYESLKGVSKLWFMPIPRRNRALWRHAGCSKLHSTRR